MLTKDMKDRISVVAAINGGRISIQSLKLIAMTYNEEDTLEALKAYCEEKHIVVYDDLEGYVEETPAEDDEDDTSVILSLNDLVIEPEPLPEWVDSLNYTSVSENLKEVLRWQLPELDSHDRELVIYLFGLKDEPLHTYAEAADKFGISHERVRQIMRRTILRPYWRLRKRKRLITYLSD